MNGGEEGEEGGGAQGQLVLLAMTGAQCGDVATVNEDLSVAEQSRDDDLNVIEREAVEEALHAQRVAVGETVARRERELKILSEERNLRLTARKRRT